MAGSTRGRPSKGDRQLVQTRNHRLVVERLDQEAKRLGLNRSDTAAVLISRALGMEQYAPELPQPTGQEVLPLGRTA